MLPPYQEKYIWDIWYQIHEKSIKCPLSAMVWGCKSPTGVGKICFLKRSINFAPYQDLLNHFLISYPENKLRYFEFIFQHDLAPFHTMESTKGWFRKKRIPAIDLLANCPDANPIENLWGILEEIKKILSIKSGWTDVSHYWNVGSSVIRDLTWFN